MRQMFDAFLWLESHKLVLLMVPYEPPNRESSRDLHCPRRWNDLMTSPGAFADAEKGGWTSGVSKLIAGNR